MDRCIRSQESAVRPAFRFAFFITLLCGVLSMSGCAVSESLDSFSDSSGSVSDSLGSFSDSSESSSGSSGDETAYRNDLRDYTVAHLRAHLGAEGSPEALRLGISEVALSRGITNWEALPSSFLAIGEGFAEAGLTLAEAAPYRNALAEPDSASAANLIAGHNHGQPPSVTGRR